MKKIVTIIAIVLAIAVGDLALTYNNFIVNSDYFVKNEKDFEGYVIVTFDLNNLKQCNDQYGHRAGDEYIINAAHIIEDNFERYGKCYRIGGDEFCCIIPKGRYFKIERVMHKIDQDVEILNHKNIIPVPVGIAYGYAVFTADDTDPEKVRERADEDMYRNKKAMKQSWPENLLDC